MALFDERLEAGPWFEAGRRLDGCEASALMAEAVTGEIEEAVALPPYCVYVHVPWCRRGSMRAGDRVTLAPRR